MPNSNLYSFGRDRRGRDFGLEESLKLPGVGKYDSEVSGILNSSPKVGFGTGPRQGIHDPSKDYLPGPGTYKNNQGALNGPKQTMRPKLKYAPEEKE
jgi:hypothetical protein